MRVSVYNDEGNKIYVLDKLYGDYYPCLTVNDTYTYGTADIEELQYFTLLDEEAPDVIYERLIKLNYIYEDIHDKIIQLYNERFTSKYWVIRVFNALFDFSWHLTSLLLSILIVFKIHTYVTNEYDMSDDTINEFEPKNNILTHYVYSHANKYLLNDNYIKMDRDMVKSVVSIKFPNGFLTFHIENNLGYVFNKELILDIFELLDQVRVMNENGLSEISTKSARAINEYINYYR